MQLVTSYDPLKISIILAKSLTHNIAFAKFIKILLTDVVSSRTSVRLQSKYYPEVTWFHIFQFFIKRSMSPKYFKNFF